MVLAYLCPEHGFHRECDVNEGGQRICPEGGPAVTGITGRTRWNDAQKQQLDGEIAWNVFVSWGSHKGIVHAHDFQQALERAIETYRTNDGPPTITEIKPRYSAEVRGDA